VPDQWDPDRYLSYADERGRPFVDLLARVGAEDPRAVVDLGCGPGNLTALLRRRWPEARVRGVDSSPAMVERARAAGIEASLADVREWRPEEPVDVLVSNAALQWVPDHLALLPRLVAAVRPGGWFAMQVPGNFDEPSHALREELAGEAPYAEHLAGTLARPGSHEPAAYWEVLDAAGRADVWETTYLHVLTGEDAVFEWISGTSLRPTRAALPDELWEGFAAELRRRLRAAYPTRAGGRVILPFRRIFAVVAVTG
jgi:trans-aconitate 2-methyltransferase